MAQSEKKYRHKIVYLSFILSIMVVMIHSYNIDMYAVENPVLKYVENCVTSLSRIAVPTFFALSGFLFFQNYTPKMYFKKIKSRFFSVLIPFFIWNLLSYLVFAVLSVIPFTAARINTEAAPLTVNNLLMSLISTDYNHTWFLKNLIVYIAVVPILYPLLKSKYIGGIFIAIIHVIGCKISNDYLIWSLFYLFGAYAALHFKDIVQSYYEKKIQSALFCVVDSIILNQTSNVWVGWELKDKYALQHYFTDTSSIDMDSGRYLLNRC